MDTDGTCSHDFGVIEYSSKSNTLAEDVAWLSRSLGYNCRKASKIINGETYYRVYIYSNDPQLFNLERKKNHLKPKCAAAAVPPIIRTFFRNFFIVITSFV